MSKPDFFNIVTGFASAINSALATEFNVTAPYQADPQAGESFVIWVPGQYRRESYDQVAIEGEVWFVKGYQDFTSLAAEAIGLMYWLEHSFPTVRETLLSGLTGAQRHGFANFTPGSSGNDENPAVLPTISSKQYGTKQVAPWCLTLKMPCSLVLNAKRCY